MSEPETPPCMIMRLPDELLVPAARTAVEIEPRNQPARVMAASFSPQQVAVLTTKYWGSKPRTLSVQFLDNPTAAFRRMFLEAANSWDCGITFAETAGQGEVRLSRAGSGYWSYLGTDILSVPADRPTMNLQGFTEHTRSPEWLRVPPHEVGHTLGMPHEHLRKVFVDDIDPEKAFPDYRAMGWSWEMFVSNVKTPLEEASLLGATAPDQTSIMAYQVKAAHTYSGKPILGGLRLGPVDLAYVDAIYPKPAGPVGPPSPPVEPPPSPPVRPPDPGPAVEEFGPYDLRIGVPSDKFTLLPGTSVLFRFRARATRVFFATTASKADLTMDLLGDRKETLRHDDDSGLKGNPLVYAPLKPGTYYLRIQGSHPEVVGPFRVKVEALS